MCQKINASVFLLFITIFLLSACDKDNLNKKLGQYAVSIKYKGDTAIPLHFFIDGKESGTVQVINTDRPSSVNDCKDLKKPENLVNVFVIKNVTVGKHQIEIKTDKGTLLENLEFNMFDKECVFQMIEIPLDKLKDKKPTSLF